MTVTTAYTKNLTDPDVGRRHLPRDQHRTTAPVLGTRL